MALLVQKAVLLGFFLISFFRMVYSAEVFNGTNNNVDILIEIIVREEWKDWGSSLMRGHMIVDAIKVVPGFQAVLLPHRQFLAKTSNIKGTILKYKEAVCVCLKYCDVDIINRCKKLDPLVNRTAAAIAMLRLSFSGSAKARWRTSM